MTKPAQTLADFIRTLPQDVRGKAAHARVVAAGFTASAKTVNTYISKRDSQTTSKAPSSSPLPRGDSEVAFARLVARIGTDRAAELLEQAKHRRID